MEFLIFTKYCLILLTGHLKRSRTHAVPEKSPADQSQGCRYTNWLYDFRDILNNRYLVFPYCSILLDANRHPEIIDESVPIQDIEGRSVYREGHALSIKMRKQLSSKYLTPFNADIAAHIRAGAAFFFDGHSTVTARGVADNQIDLMNFQHSRLDDGPIYYCPDIY